MTYEELLSEAYDLELTVKEKPLKANKGRIKGSRIAIKKDIPTNTEKACVLAEELGHYHTTTGDIINLQDIRNRKQELKARVWAYNKKIGLMGIVKCFEHRCTCRADMAEYLNVTEEFLMDAICYYKSKYGMNATIDNYIIYFEPNLGVMKIF